MVDCGKRRIFAAVFQIIYESAMLEQRNYISSTLLSRSISDFGHDNYARIVDMLTGNCDIGFFQRHPFESQTH